MEQIDSDSPQKIFKEQVRDERLQFHKTTREGRRRRGRWGGG